MNRKLIIVSLGFVSALADATNYTTEITDFLSKNKKAVSTNFESISCYLYGDYSFYDLRALQNNESDYNAASFLTGDVYTFNFCQYTTEPCGNASASAYAYKTFVATGSCELLTDGAYLPDHIDSVAFDNSTQEPRHIKFTQDGGEVCAENTTLTNTITFEIFCDTSVTGRPSITDFSIDTSEDCHSYVSFSHSAGCPVANVNGLVAYFTENPWIIAVFLIVAGFIMNWWGGKFIPWVVAIFSGVVTFLIVLLISSVLGLLDYIDPTQDGGNVGLVVLAFILAFTLGGLVGFLMKRFFLIGFCILGFFAGYTLGGLLYSLVFISFIQSTYFLGFLTFGLGAVTAFLCYKQRDHLAILTTALLGAYAFVRGISMFVGNYPNEIQLYQDIKNNTATYSYAFIGYLAGMAVLFVLGSIYQEKTHRHHVDEHFSKSR